MLETELTLPEDLYFGLKTPVHILTEKTPSVVKFSEKDNPVTIRATAMPQGSTSVNSHSLPNLYSASLSSFHPQL